MDWSKVHEEAEQLEHVVSDEVISRMDDLLGHPSHDPHGDPIPTTDGTLPERPLQLLSFCDKGDSVSIARIGNQNANFLQFAQDNGLLLGARIEVTNRNDIADSMTIHAKGKEVVLGLAAAGRIEVEYA
jgi:DtxR family Mn-dependent transcriptional regulator